MSHRSCLFQLNNSKGTVHPPKRYSVPIDKFQTLKGKNKHHHLFHCRVTPGNGSMVKIENSEVHTLSLVYLSSLQVVEFVLLYIQKLTCTFNQHDSMKAHNNLVRFSICQFQIMKHFSITCLVKLTASFSVNLLFVLTSSNSSPPFISSMTIKILGLKE